MEGLDGQWKLGIQNFLELQIFLESKYFTKNCLVDELALAKKDQNDPILSQQIASCYFVEFNVKALLRW